MKRSYFKKLLMIVFAVLFMTGCGGSSDPNKVEGNNCTFTIKKLDHHRADFGESVTLHLVFENKSGQANCFSDLVNFKEGFFSNSCDFKLYQGDNLLTLTYNDENGDKKIKDGEKINVQVYYQDYDLKGDNKVKVVYTGGSKEFSKEYKVTAEKE